MFNSMVNKSFYYHLLVVEKCLEICLHPCSKNEKWQIFKSGDFVGSGQDFDCITHCNLNQL